MDWPQDTKEFSIQCGQVKSVNIDDGDSGRVVTVGVFSFHDCSIIPIRVDCPLHMQYIPVVGQLVLFMRTANNSVRIIAHFGEGVFTAPIKPGEVLIEGAGHGFVHLNGAGDVTVGDGYMSNVQRFFAGIGISITSDGYSLNVKDVGQINITPQDDALGNKNQIEIIKTKGGKTTGRIVLTDEKTLMYASTIEVGKDPDIVSGDLKGGVVHSTFPTAPTGPMNFCFMTGAPYPCSASVRVSK